MSLFHIDAGKEWRGGQRQAFFLAGELRKRGYSFQFVVQPGSPLHLRADEAGLPVLPLRIRSDLDIISVVKLARKMRRWRCRLVHCHDAHSAAVGSAAASLAGVPLRVISRRVSFPLKKNIFSRRKYTKKIDAIIAISESVKKTLIEAGIPPGTIETIPSGIDLSPYEERVSKDHLRRELHLAAEDFLVGTIGHLSEDKSHETFIRAAGILRKRAPRIKLIIAGKGPLEKELKRTAEKIQVEGSVFFLGFRGDVPQILSSLDVFVLPSLQEGLGSIILDAMASRLPVVASNVGGIPEVVVNRETGILVPADDPDSLAEAVLRLYENRDMARKFGARGREIVRQNYSVESMAERVIQLYDKLAEKKGITLVR